MCMVICLESTDGCEYDQRQSRLAMRKSYPPKSHPAHDSLRLISSYLHGMVEGTHREKKDPVATSQALVPPSGMVSAFEASFFTSLFSATAGSGSTFVLSEPRGEGVFVIGSDMIWWSVV